MRGQIFKDERWIIRKFEIDVYALLYFKWITNKDLLV